MNGHHTQAIFPELDVHAETEQPQHRTTVEVLPSADVLDTLAGAPAVKTTILDPWYNKGLGGERTDYNDWLATVIRSACRISEHVFVWGFPEILAYQVARIPEGFKLKGPYIRNDLFVHGLKHSFWII